MDILRAGNLRYSEVNFSNIFEALLEISWFSKIRNKELQDTDASACFVYALVGINVALPRKVSR